MDVLWVPLWKVEVTASDLFSPVLTEKQLKEDEFCWQQQETKKTNNWATKDSSKSVDNIKLIIFIPCNGNCDFLAKRERESTVLIE